MRNILFGSTFIFLGIVMLLIRNKYKNVPLGKSKDYYSKEQVMNTRIIGGIGFIIIGLIIIILYLI